MRAIRYSTFRESKSEHYITIEGKMSRAELIKKLESFLSQNLGEGQEFFDQYKVREE